MEAIWITTIVCLLLALGAITLRLIHYKREMRHFASEIDRLKSDEYAQPIKISCFDKDLTKLAVRLNEYVEAWQKKEIEHAKERNKLNNVISGVSHDFRTPLTASLGYLQLMEKSGELSAKNGEYLSVVMQKNRYLKELSDEFFELSTMKDDTKEVMIEEINLSNLLSNLLMEQYNWLEERRITPEINIADGIVVKGNLQYLTRIILNLMSNAEKYAVSHFNTSLLQSEGRTALVVSNDTAEGDLVMIDQIFEPFYKSPDRNKKGTGLGLYVVKCLSDKMGYSVEVKLSRDKIFCIELII